MAMPERFCVYRLLTLRCRIPDHHRPHMLTLVSGQLIVSMRRARRRLMGERETQRAGLEEVLHPRLQKSLVLGSTVTAETRHRRGYRKGEEDPWKRWEGKHCFQACPGLMKLLPWPSCTLVRLRPRTLSLLRRPWIPDHQDREMYVPVLKVGRFGTCSRAQS